MMEGKEDTNEIFIGKKPFMVYVTAVVMQFNMGIQEVVIKARGQYISRAVDVAEVSRNRFLKDVIVKDIKISSDEFEGDNGRKIRISAIEIRLGKYK